MELFKLVGKIMVDSAEAINSISKTGKEAEGLGGKLAGGIKTAAKWAAGVGAAATAAGGAMVAFANKVSKQGDEIDKMSQRLGVTRKAYQELNYVMGQSGVDVNSFQTGMKSLLANMDKVTEGNKTATANFEKLGVSVTNADGSMRGQEETLYDVISAFQHMEDGAEKSRLAQELFGKQGQEILPLLNSEAGSFEALTKAANDMGIVLEDSAIDSSVKLHDMIDNVTRQIDALKTNLMAEIMPYVVEIVEWISANLPVITDAVKRVVDFIMPYVRPVLNGVLSLVQAVFKLINGDFEGFKEGIKTALKKFGEGLLTLGKDAMSFLWSGFKSVWNGIHEWVQDKIGWLKDKLTFWRDSQNEMSGGERGGYGNSGTYSAYSGGAGRTTETQNINVMVDGEVLTTAVVNRVRNEARMA